MASQTTKSSDALTEAELPEAFSPVMAHMGSDRTKVFLARGLQLPRTPVAARGEGTCIYLTHSDSVPVSGSADTDGFMTQVTNSS